MGRRYIRGPRPVALSRDLEDGWQPDQGGVADQKPQRRRPDRSLADVLVAVPVRTKRDLRVVEVKAAQPSEPDDGVEVGHHLVGLLQRGEADPRGPQVLCIEANARVDRRTSVPAAPSNVANSSKLRPTVPPVPAAFSSSIGHPPAGWVAEGFEECVDYLRHAVARSPVPLWLPTWRTSPEAPMPVATARLAARQAFDRSKRSGWSEARLIK